MLGHGGIRLVARAAGVREATVSVGVDELDSGAEPLGREEQDLVQALTPKRAHEPLGKCISPAATGPGS